MYILKCSIDTHGKNSNHKLSILISIHFLKRKYFSEKKNKLFKLSQLYILTTYFTCII